MVNGAFMSKVESMTVISCGSGIIENCLVRYIKLKQLLEYKSGFSGTESIGYIKAQYKPQHMFRVINLKEIDGFAGFCR